VVATAQNKAGNGIPGLSIQFSAAQGTVAPTTATTDASGQANATWFPQTVGNASLFATVVGTNVSTQLALSVLQPSLSGTWRGTTTAGALFVLTLIDNGGVVTGTAVISQSTVLAGSVAGVLTWPTARLTISVAGFQPVTITGNPSSATQIPSSILGSGWVNEPIVLTKQ
jgi:hypothetical protein